MNKQLKLDVDGKNKNQKGIIFGLILLRSTSFDCAGCNTNYISFYNQLILFRY